MFELKNYIFVSNGFVDNDMFRIFSIKELIKNVFVFGNMLEHVDILMHPKCQSFIRPHCSSHYPKKT